MTPPRAAIVIGAASPLGALVVRRLVGEGGRLIVAADLPEHLGYMEKLARFLGAGPDRLRLALLDLGKTAFGMDYEVEDIIAGSQLTLFHLGNTQDRTLRSDEIRAFNNGMCRHSLELAMRAADLEAILVTTDIGLAGDYPGRFYETWIDAQQVTFDEVDRTNLEIEQTCAANSSMPVVRARIGLLSDVPVAIPEGTHWKRAAEVLLPGAHILRHLPRMLAIPTIVARGSAAPLTPVAWAAEAIASLASQPEARGRAVHLVLRDQVPMEHVLAQASAALGGARIHGGVPMRLVETLGSIPGLKEMARRQADQLGSLWTPHRYCLSRNDFDTTQARALLPRGLETPTWRSVRSSFFRPVG